MEEDTEEGDVENKIGGIVKNDDAERYDESRNGSNHNRDPLSACQVRVLWMDDSETINTLNDLTVVDRGFLHGDYVASDLDPTGQVGLVVDVNISVDLLAPDGSIAGDVSSKDLKRVRDFTVGDYVVFGPWLGRVDDVLDNVTVSFDDGSICKVMRAEPLRLRPISKNLLEDGQCPYHPGQRVRASSPSVFRHCRFLSGSWKSNRREGTVIKVTVGSVYVHWIASAGYGLESSTAPAEEQNPKNLKLLSCFTHANWQLGDWCLLPSLALSPSIPLAKGSSKVQVQEESASAQSVCDLEDVMPEELNGNNELMDFDGAGGPDGADRKTQSNASGKSSFCGNSLSVSKEPVHGTWPILRKKLCKFVVKMDKKPQRKEESFERAFLIVNTRTRVDVAWQNGTIERGLNSTSLIPIESPGDHEFVAEQYVVEKGTSADDSSEIRRVGVVNSVNAKEKTACVRWLKPVARPEDPREFDKEEIVSVYELEGHPDYDYCYGDVVVRLSPVSLPAETANSCFSIEEQTQPNGSDEVKRDPKKHFASGEEACTEFTDLSWVGNITGLMNGDIEVTWADGMVSTVGPQAVYVVGRDDDDDTSTVAGSEISDDGASWETVEDDERDALDVAEKELEPPSCTSSNPGAGESSVAGEHNHGRNGPLSIPLAAIGFVTRLASGIFSLGQKQLDSIGLEFKGEDGEHSQEESNISDGRASSNGFISQDSTVIGSGSEQNDTAKGHGIGNTEAAKVLDVLEASCNLRTEEPHDLSCHGDDACNFKRFDIAKDPVDHFFVGANEQINSRRKWLKKVQQDWNILQNNLPDGIYVRVYEDQMDLLRAVIIGAYGTPYQDGLFFFDFHLPPEYPDVPPSAHYHSGGWRINPNLYEEGKVCLSLLNTWTGRGNEVWDPKSSSILQVLVSLQGLVLNSKPYFNEAGYDKQIGTAEGEKNSLSYNENTFLLNCKTMMYLIRKPPKDFEDLVRCHFKRRGYYILKACDAYMKGYLIGSLSKDASITEKSDANATSVGFKLMLAKIVPKLFSALSELGADCHDFKHLQQL
ncbi:hypothetical protein Nepgr_019691 [Nepenthes gracilis]|uniref:E2 ubiquitin-conjugating enzyme n=1 Tax=Nepenthes gracilis TaxID=150966 RepID=A0AAD3XVG8_NEPGR|nr:hypothetical protein Nepgr_019691 [Nepenthes gracilis]